MSLFLFVLSCVVFNIITSFYILIIYLYFHPDNILTKAQYECLFETFPNFNMISIPTVSYIIYYLIKYNLT